MDLLKSRMSHWTWWIFRCHVGLRDCTPDSFSFWVTPPKTNILNLNITPLKRKSHLPKSSSKPPFFGFHVDFQQKVTPVVSKACACSGIWWSSDGRDEELGGICGRDLGGTGGRVAFVKEFLEFSLEFGARSQNPVRKEYPPVNYHGNGTSSILMIFTRNNGDFRWLCWFSGGYFDTFSFPWFYWTMVGSVRCHCIKCYWWFAGWWLVENTSDIVWHLCWCHDFSS